MGNVCFFHLAILMFLGIHAILLETRFAVANSIHNIKHPDPALSKSAEFTQNKATFIPLHGIKLLTK
jgi:hypothetical protein